MSVGLDLTGVPREFRARTTSSPLWVRVLSVLGPAVLAVLAAARGTWIAVVVWGLLAVVDAVFVLGARRLLLVRLDEDALHVRRGFHLRRVPWEEVEGVVVQGRSEPSSSVLLHSGSRLPLLGVGPGDAERLARALRLLSPDPAS